MQQENTKYVMTKNSLSEEMGDLTKSSVHKVLDDDYESKNSMNSAMKMTSKCKTAYMKMNVLCPMNTKDGALNMNCTDNMEVKLRMWGLDMKGKLKGNRWFEHYDFGIYNKKITLSDKKCSLWINPYFRWGASRTLANPVFNFGSLISWCSAFSTRVQLNCDSKNASDEYSAWSLSHKLQWTHKNFWLDWLYTFNFAHPKQVDSRTIRGGWSDKTWSVNGEVNKLGYENTRAIDDFSLGVAYDGGSVGTFAARIKNNMEENTMQCSVGASRKINDKTSAKLRVDSKTNADLWGTYKIGDGHTFTGTLSTNFKESEKVEGVFDYPVKFGVKYKIDK